MNETWVKTATIKAKVLSSRLIHKDINYPYNNKVELIVLVKEISYTGPCECKNSKIEFEDFSKKTVFHVTDHNYNDNFVGPALDLVRGDIITFSVVNDGYCRYHFTSLKCEGGTFYGLEGITEIIENNSEEPSSSQ